MADRDDVYRFFFEEYNLPSLILKKDEISGEYIIADVNKKALEVEGIKKEDYKGKSFPEVCDSLKSGIFCSIKKEEIILNLNNLTYGTGYKKSSHFSQYNIFTYTKDSGEIILSYDPDYGKHSDYEDLRIKARQLKIILDKLPIGVWFADKNGKLVFANPAGEGIWNEKKYVGTRDYGVFKAWFYDTKKPVGAEDWALLRTIKNREVVERELLEIESFDGKRKIIYNWTLPVIEGNGDLLGAVVINQEVTETIRAREALKESELRFRSLISYSSDIVSIVDKDGVIKFQSPSAKNILGYDPDSMIGTGMFDYLHPDDKKITQDIWVNVLRNPGVTYSPAVRFRRSDGSYAYLEPVSTNLTDDPVISGIIINSRDITIRHKAEELIEENRKNFYDIVKQLPKPLILMDKSGKMLYLNNQFVELFGYGREEIKTDDDWFEHAFPDIGYRNIVRKQWKNKLIIGKSGPDDNQSHDVTCKDGSIKKIQFMTVNLEDEKLMILMRDVTERVLSIEREKTALLQIEDNIRKLSILNDTIRNPLAVIVGIADMTGGRESEIILDQAKEIDKTIDELDRGWIESAKIREFLIKHYGHEKNE